MNLSASAIRALIVVAAGAAAWAGVAASSPHAPAPGYADASQCTPIRPQQVVQTKAKTVSLAFLVDANGEVQDTRLIRSSGQQELDQATLDAFRRCTFHPSVFRGQPQRSWVMLSYRWELPID